jgi:hypothetical protein
MLERKKMSFFFYFFAFSEPLFCDFCIDYNKAYYVAKLFIHVDNMCMYQVVFLDLNETQKYHF